MSGPGVRPPGGRPPGARAADGSRGGAVPVRRAVVAVAVLALATLGGIAGAQPPVTRPPAVPGAGALRGAGADTLRRAPGDTARRAPGDTSRAPGDTVSGDSAETRRELVQWAEADSAITALMQREGYDVVRYQGDTVSFLAQDRVLQLRGVPAAVRRDSTQLVGAAIRYDDSTRIVVASGDSARGDTVVLRDPAQGSDVIVRGNIRYDLNARRGVVTAFSTAVTSGETWYVNADRGALVSDTVIQGRRFVYARDGSITSCNEELPHYHFQARSIKMVTRSILVVRPAVLYIGDVPVLWLPFVFQDMRSGRRSGFLPPRIGLNNVFRNSATFQRNVENVGYYFNLGDYADARAWFDWRSDARRREFDAPGMFRLNLQSDYRWLDRFMRGNAAVAYESQRDGSRNTSFSLQHAQEFSRRSRLNASINWVTNTRVYRQNLLNPVAVLGTIASQANYQYQLGQAQLSLGGTRRQYPGRSQVDQDFPSLSITSQPLAVSEWLTWTPSLNFTNSESRSIDQGVQFDYLFTPRPGGGLDSARVSPSTRNTRLSFETPLRIFDFDWQNSFAFSEVVDDRPQTRVIFDVNDTTRKETRLFAQTYRSDIDWTTGFSLPRFFQGTWNLSPTLTIANVDAGYGFFVRTERTGGQFVRQSKRLQGGVSAAPTFYAFAPGLGPVERFRHSITTSASWGYSPAASVSDEFLRAVGRTRQGYLGALQQNRVTLQLATNLEAKLRSRGDSAAAEQKKVRVASVNFSSLSYDFARADTAGSGFTDRTFSYNARSDLLPGLEFRSAYDLFLGDPVSDTAEFKPYRTETSVNFTLDQNSGVVRLVGRLFGKGGDAPLPATSAPQGAGEPEVGDPNFARQAIGQRVAGSASRAAQFNVPTAQGWTANFSYTSSRQRPDIRGPIIDIDPTSVCNPLRLGTNASSIAYDLCVLNQRTAPQAGTTNPYGETTLGAPIFRQPAQRAINSALSFHLTPKWGVQWSTTYDFTRSEFGSQQVTLQRELHDWLANFAFTQSPNGNFAFTFFISLKAQPDLKFDFNRQTYRGTGTTSP